MFLNDLDLRAIGTDEWVLLSPLKYHFGIEQRIDGPAKLEKILAIPTGFITDLASVPRGARWLVTGQDRTRRPAVLHDYLYRRKIGSRKWADRVFRDAMRQEKVAFWKRWLCWSAVRGFGWLSRK